MYLENNVVSLDGMGDFEIVDTLVDNKIKYVLLVNSLDTNDICIRKIVNENNKEYLEYLGEAEFDNIIHKFIEKNKDLFE